MGTGYSPARGFIKLCRSVLGRAKRPSSRGGADRLTQVLLYLVDDDVDIVTDGGYAEGADAGMHFHNLNILQSRLTLQEDV